MNQDYSFDPTKATVADNPGVAYAELANRYPFYRMQNEHQQFWISSDYEEIKQYILQDNPDWSFKWGSAAKDTAHDIGIVTDPPFHMAFRAVLAPGLSPKALYELKKTIEALASNLISQMRTHGPGDLHDLFALPLPAKVMCIMLGLPPENYMRYKHWADELQSLMFHDHVRGSHKELFNEIYTYFVARTEERRALLAEAAIDSPDMSHLGSVLPDDYISRSVCARIDGRPLTDMEIVNICVTFLTGGQETTTNLIGNMVWRLLEQPKLWRELCANPDKIEVAIEESLRFDPPVLAHFRTSVKEFEMHGETIPDHGKIMFSISGANRDPERFPNPNEFRLDRPLPQLRQHLSFGAGVHRCLGAGLARLEGQIALRLLIENFPNLHLAGPTERIDTWMYWGRKKIPVAW